MTEMRQLETPATRWGASALLASSSLTKFDNQSLAAQERAMAGRTAYRDEFERDHGPDPDERLDSNESGHEL
jgi:hypothetical protein